jgi:hypothetical protein
MDTQPGFSIPFTPGLISGAFGTAAGGTGLYCLDVLLPGGGGHIYSAFDLVISEREGQTFHLANPGRRFFVPADIGDLSERSIGGIFVIDPLSGYLVLGKRKVVLRRPGVGPVLFLVALWLLIGKKYSAIGGIIASDIGLMLLGMLRDPAWMMKFAAYSNQKLAANFGYSPTFWGVSGAICRHQPGCTLILAWSLCLLTVAFTIFLLLRDKRLSRSFLILGLITPVALLVTPYLWVYDQILLVAPIAMFMLVMMEGEKPYLLSALVFITIAILSWALLGLALNVGNDAWSASLPGICIVFYIWVIRTINLDRGNRFQKDAISSP